MFKVAARRFRLVEGSDISVCRQVSINVGTIHFPGSAFTN